MKKLNFSKLGTLITSAALLVFAVAGLSTNKVALAGTSYPSPGANTTPEIVPIVHNNEQYDGRIGNDYEDIDFGELEYILKVNMYSFKEVVNNPEFSEAPEGSENKKIYDSLVNAYNLYITRPVRAFNNEILTDQLAKDLSGNDDFDARNFAASYLFELVLEPSVREFYSAFLNASKYTYIQITFKSMVETEKAPVIVYRCNDYELDGGERDTTTEIWSVNQTGVVSVSGGYTLFTYRFYSLCPMFFLETSPSTLELQQHAEWGEEYPTNPGFNTSKFIIPFIIIFAGASCAAGSISYVLSSKKKD